MGNRSSRLRRYVLDGPLVAERSLGRDIRGRGLGVEGIEERWVLGGTGGLGEVGLSGKVSEEGELGSVSAYLVACGLGKAGSGDVFLSCERISMHALQMP